MIEFSLLQSHQKTLYPVFTKTRDVRESRDWLLEDWFNIRKQIRILQFTYSCTTQDTTQVTDRRLFRQTADWTNFIDWHTVELSSQSDKTLESTCAQSGAQPTSWTILITTRQVFNTQSDWFWFGHRSFSSKDVQFTKQYYTLLLRFVKYLLKYSPATRATNPPIFLPPTSTTSLSRSGQRQSKAICFVSTSLFLHDYH